MLRAAKRRHAAAANPPAKRSRRKSAPAPWLADTFFNVLVKRVCKGSQATAAQQEAASAHQVAQLAGARPIPGWQGLASIGSNGRNPQNCVRDYSRWLSWLSDGAGLHLHDYKVAVTLQLHPSQPPETHYWPMFLPHELFHAIYTVGGELWQNVLGGEAAEVERFWAHERNFAWVREHPARRCGSRTLHDLIPISIHGDEVAYSKRSKGLVLSCTSDVSRACTLDKSLLILFLPADVCIKDITVDEVLSVLPWSFDCLMRGEFPTHDHLGRPFGPSDGWRFKMRRRRLMGHWRGAFSHVRNDLEWGASIFKYNHYRMNKCCHFCGATKDDPQTVYTDCRDCAGWRPTLVSHEQYIAATELGERSAICRIGGWRLERNLTDVMHGLHLGNCGHLVGNVLWELATEDARPRPQALAALHALFMDWRRNNNIKCSQPCFTQAMCNRPSGERLNYPEFHGKASNTGKVCKWLGVYVRGLAAHTSHQKLRALACWSMADFLNGMDDADRVLSGAEVDRLTHAGMTYLRSTQVLAREAVDNGERAWNQPLKWHMFCHVVDDIKVYRRNPRFNWCFSDEDFAGHMAAIAAASHRSTVGARSLERWVGLLYIRIRELALQDHICARGGA